ncbi:hypothetical protein WH292_08510 [Enterobacter sp. MYb186]
MTDDAKKSDDKSSDEQGGASFLGSRLPDRTLSNASFSQLLHDLKNPGHNTGTSQRQFFDEGELMTADELDAKLCQSKAEVSAIASEMRREMAEWREKNNSQLAELTIAINSLSAKVDGKMDSIDGDVKSINGKFEGFQGQINGINTAISGIQSGITTKLALFGAFITLVVALPGLMALFKNSPPPQNSSPPPIIIQVPQQQLPLMQQQSQDPLAPKPQQPANQNNN